MFYYLRPSYCSSAIYNWETTVMRHWDRKLRDKMSLSHMWIYWITSLIYNIIKVGVDKITLGRPLLLPLQNTGLSACVLIKAHIEEKRHMECGN